MHPRRLVRLNELILQTVSEATLDLKDPGLGFITITGAELSPDVSVARIFYSVLGTAEQRAETAAALDRAKSYVRSQVGKLENLRRVPQIAFTYDDTIERADRVNKIFNKLQDEENV